MSKYIDTTLNNIIDEKINEVNEVNELIKKSNKFNYNNIKKEEIDNNKLKELKEKKEEIDKLLNEISNKLLLNKYLENHKNIFINGIKNKIIYIINENDTFNIEFYKEDKELDIIRYWMNKIGNSIEFEYSKIIDISDSLKKNLQKILKINYNIKLFNINKLDELILYYINIYDNKDIFNLTELKNNNENSNEKKNFINTINNNFLNNNENSNIIKPCNIESYNFYYLNDDNDNYNYLYNNYENIINNKEILYIISNTKSLITFIEYNLTDKHIEFLNNNNYGFNIEFKKEIFENNNIKNNNIFDMINNKYYENLDELNACVLNTKNLFENNIEIYNEEEKVTKIIKNIYKITDNINDKIKASELFEKIYNELIYFQNIKIKNKITFRNRFSKYLINMKLKKKRFSDGFYYYGLIQK
jgi:hypothetical protein